MSANYWNTKLEKIQFAIEVLEDIKAGQNIDVRLAKLRTLETETCDNLIEAEQEEANEQR